MTGLGIESSSFRNGCPHESVLEMDVLTGDGRIVTATPTSEHAGAVLRLPELLRHARLRAAAAHRARAGPAVRACSPTSGSRRRRRPSRPRLDEVCRRGTLRRRAGRLRRRHRVRPHEHYLTLGTFVDEAPYAQRLHRPGHLLPVDPAPAPRLPDGPRLPVALGHRLVLVLAGARRAEPAGAPAGAATRYLRSDVYWKVVGFERRHGVDGPGRRAGAASRDARGRHPGRRGPGRARRRVPRRSSTARSASSRSGCARCASATRTSSGTCTRSTRARTYVNVGFWSSVDAAARASSDGDHNRRIEQVVAELGGRKSLYSHGVLRRGHVLGHLQRGGLRGAARRRTTRTAGCRPVRQDRRGRPVHDRRRDAWTEGHEARSRCSSCWSARRLGVRFVAYDGSAAGPADAGGDARAPLADGAALHRDRAGRPRPGPGVRHRQPRRRGRPVRRRCASCSARRRSRRCRWAEQARGRCATLGPGVAAPPAAARRRRRRRRCAAAAGTPRRATPPRSATTTTCRTSSTPGARPVDGLHLRGVPEGRRDAGGGAGREVRPGLPQARPASRACGCSTSAAAGAAWSCTPPSTTACRALGVTLSRAAGRVGRARRSPSAGLTERRRGPLPGLPRRARDAASTRSRRSG